MSAELDRQSKYYHQPGQEVGYGPLHGLKACAEWPGVVAKTCHTYKDSYFDDNYYTAFRRAVRDEGSNSEGHEDRLERGAGSRGKFNFSALADVSSTVIVSAKRHRGAENNIA